MKRFLILLLIFTLLLMAGFVAVLYRAGAETDEFYYRFATPTQNSLVLGTSRAAQGINPAVINRMLGRNDLFNYSFTNDHSPYGEIYLKSIQKKLSPDASSGIFILSVDPWCLSSVVSAPDDITLFRENGLMLDKMKVVDMHPNFFYLMQFYDEPYSHLLAGAHDEELVLKENGWLEVNVPMDSANIKRRTESRMKDYREKVKPSYAPSNLRMTYLESTIKFLQEHGQVYLVRVPVSIEMKSIEDEYYPNFDFRMEELSSKCDVPYFNLRESEKECTFTDGNHLSKASADKVSAQIGERILATTQIDEQGKQK